MSSAGLDDYRWLIGAEAAIWLVKVAADLAGAAPTPAVVRSLRTSLGPLRTSLVLEQVELRAKARRKFSRADELFFTRRGLEQATDEILARYKAQRFSECCQIADLCCGIGGDAMALGTDRTLTLVDRDEATLLLAAANVEKATGARPDHRAEEVAQVHVVENEAWHIDPDRRSTGQRVARAELAEPGIEVIESLLAECPNAAIKLAPVAALSDEWRPDCEREWIETRGECRQQVAWCGRLADFPGRRTATLIDSSGEACSFSAEPHSLTGEVDRLRKYLFDPVPSLVAARLVGSLADVLDLYGVSSHSLYLTGDAPVLHPLLQTFEIAAELPLDVRQLRSYLQSCGIGRLEIKKRGVDVTPEQLRPQLQLQGDEEATLVLTRVGDAVRALVCRRVES